MTDFFDRLDKYMTHSGLNDNRLTVVAGLSVGSLGRQRKTGRGLSSDSIAKILHSCSDLNAEWLLTGNGTMLKDSQCQAPLPEVPRDLTLQMILERDEKLIRENERLRMQLGAANKQELEKFPPPIEEIYIPDKQ